MNHRTLLVAGFIFSFAPSFVLLHAETKQEKFWREYISNCFPAGSIGKDARYIDSTNLSGPGSVWGKEGGTINLVGSEDSYLGEPKDGKYILVKYAASTATCGAKGAKTLGIDIGVPFSVTGGAYSADISTAIGTSRDITVAIDKAQLDRIPTAEWSDEMVNHAKPGSAVFRDAVDGKHYLLNAAVAVSGLTITYKVTSQVAASLTAKIQAGEMVTLGTSDKPLHANLTVNGANNEITMKFTDRAYVLGEFKKIDKLEAQSDNKPHVDTIKPKVHAIEQ